MKRIVRLWLKAGVMDGKPFSPTEQGTPQGGVISPLLMNIALHGMEEVVTAGYSKSHKVEKPKLVRYADDFAIFHSTSYKGEVGLDFLGVTIRQIPVGKIHTGKNAHGSTLGYKTICKPSKDAGPPTYPRSG